MNNLKLRNKEGFWNNKFYGKDKNEIYFDNERITLKQDELDSIRQQQLMHQESETVLDYQACSRKTAQIINYIEELSKMTKDKDELKEFFTRIQKEMQNLYIKK